MVKEDYTLLRRLWRLSALLIYAGSACILA